MSIQTELARLQGARDTLRTKAIELKISAGTEKLDELAEDYNGITNNGGVSAQVKEGETYTIPKGYHDGTGTVSGVSGGGSYNLQSKTATPTKKPQQITPDEGYYGLSDVNVEAIPSQFQDTSSVTAVDADVLTGKVIVTSDGSVTPGTMPNNGAVTKVLTPSEKSYTVPMGYHSGTGTVSIETEEKTATPTKDQQVITPTSGKVLSQVTVESIPAQYVDTADGTAVATDILSGKTAYVNGSKVTGSMVNNDAVKGEIDGLSSTSFSVPAGYTTGGTVTLTGDIESALAGI